MPIPDTIYCSQQINIPPDLPDILKTFTKAAIRTQPSDVLAWSTAYFEALNKGDPLPVKKRLEIRTTGLTPGLLDVIYEQLKHRETVTLSILSKKWGDLGLPKTELMEIITAGGFAHEFELMKFFAVACSHIGGHKITDALKIVCSILTEDRDGGPDRIPYDVFKKIYFYLSGLNGEATVADMDSVCSYLEEEVAKQDGLVMPRNFLSNECPKLS